MNDLLEVAMRNAGVAVACEDDLTLLGKLEAVVQRPRRQRGDRTSHRSPASPNRSSAPVKQLDLNVVSDADVRPVLLRRWRLALALR